MSSQTMHDFLGLTLNVEQIKIIAEAAARNHTSESDFVLSAALEKAGRLQPKPAVGLEQVMGLVRAAQEEVRRANPGKRNLLEELIDERRAEAARD